MVKRENKMENGCKKIIKTIIPKRLLTIIYRRKALENLFKLRKSVREIEKRPRSFENGPKVVFVLQFPAAWNSFKTVYEAAIQKGLSVFVLCVPTFADKNGEYLSEKGLTNDSYEFCMKNKISCVDAWTDGVWYDLESYEPDYVFYSRPYDSMYPKEYKSSTVCRYAKICFIPYSYSIGSLFAKVIYNIGFISNTYICFAPSIPCMDQCKKMYKIKELLIPKSFVCLGYPNHDLYADIEREKGIKVSNILWLPRWTTSEEKNNTQSHFMPYFDKFIQFAKSHNEIQIVIRPHPLMFTNFINKKVMTEQEVKKIHQTVESMSNIIFDERKDYTISLKKADIVVSDNSSLLIDAFITGKQVIFCGEAMEYLNEEGVMMDSTFYHADKWEQVEEELENLIQGKDTLAEKRRETINKIFPNLDGKIGERVLEYIITDYKKHG